MQLFVSWDWHMHQTPPLATRRWVASGVGVFRHAIDTFDASEFRSGRAAPRRHDRRAEVCFFIGGAQGAQAEGIHSSVRAPAGDGLA
jgi:hypothetical protein